MKALIILLFFTTSILAQEFKALEIKGDVKYQTGTSEQWFELEEGAMISSSSIVSTGEKSSVKLVNTDNTVILNEQSALSVGSIKNMSTDELLLALAMEDMINVPKTNGNGSSSNTATYGTKEDDKVISVTTDDFGIKRLNGAVQLVKSGLKESSVIYAKETYRKYPDVKNIAGYRIIFADILYEKGLYEEALSEYFEIEKLELSKDERLKVESHENNINKILLNN